MPRPDLEALFLANLAATEKILSLIARKYRLTPDAAEEFASWAKLRLIEDDYAILGKFRNESSMPTFLNVVLTHLHFEYQVQERGRWRPSANAIREGALGIQLETLLVRDGIRIAEAGERLRTSGKTALSDRELAAIAMRFPRRTPLRPVQAIEPPAEVAGDARTDDLIERAEVDAELARAMAALRGALEALPSEDRTIVRLRYLGAMTVADIARALGLPQKPLYNRLKDLLENLRDRLVRAGISPDLIKDLGTGPL